jgi:RND family efflux transporter MFP subunit
MRFFSRSLIGLFMVSLTVGLLALATSSVYSALEERWNKEVRKRPSRERIFSADVLAVEVTNVAPKISSFGEIRSNRTLELRAPSPGTVITLAPAFVEGGAVTAGQLLLKIDPSDALSAVDVARADLAEAEVQVMDSEGSLRLTEDELSVDVARADLAEAEVQVMDSEVSLRLTEDELSVDVARADLAEAEVQVMDSEGSLRLTEDELSVDVARADLAEAEVQVMDSEGSLRLTEDELSVDVARADLAEAEVQLRDAEGSLRLAEDELTGAREQLDLRQRSFIRQQNLKERGLVSDVSVEAAELSLSSSNQAELSKRQAVHKAKLQVEQSRNIITRRLLNLSNAEFSRTEAIQKAELKLEQSRNIVNRRKLNLSNAEFSKTEAIQKAELKLEQSRNIVNRRKLNLSNAEFSKTEAIQKAKLKLEQSRNIVNRRKLNLSNAEFSKTEAIQKAKLKLEQSRNLINRRKLNLANAERLLADTELYASFDGRLSNVNVTLGGLLNKNERLASLVDPDNLEVSFRVSTSQYKHVIDKGGNLIESPVEVALDVMGDNLKVSGRLIRESASVNEGTSGRLLFAKLTRSTGLRPGDFVSVSVNEPVLKDVIILPASALTSNEEVLVLGDKDRLEELPVNILRRQGDTVIIRASGLEGKEVVAKSTQFLGKGIKIKPLRGQIESKVKVNAELKEKSEESDLIELDEGRRARLISAIEANTRIPEGQKKKMLDSLGKKKVSLDLVQRIESRMGG